MEIPEHILDNRTQIMLFLGSCLAGIPAGLLLDFFRTLRALFPHHALTVFAEDAVFSAGAVLMLQCYAVMFANSEMHWYFFVGGFCGFMLYFLTVGAFWMKILLRFQRSIHRFRLIFCRIWQKLTSVFVKSSETHRKSEKLSENT